MDKNKKISNRNIIKDKILKDCYIYCNEHNGMVETLNTVWTGLRKVIAKQTIDAGKDGESQKGAEY